MTRTVKEFIDELSKYPPDAKLSIYYGDHDSWGDWEDRFDDPTIIELGRSHITIITDDEYGYAEEHARKYFSETRKGNVEQ